MCAHLISRPAARPAGCNARAEGAEREYETRGIVLKPKIPVGRGLAVGGESGASTEKTTRQSTTTGKAVDLVG